MTVKKLTAVYFSNTLLLTSLLTCSLSTLGLPQPSHTGRFCERRNIDAAHPHLGAQLPC
ncbi:hypothetical protein CALCODRAFT_504192 [Calocera cornea HHB12733]|uniref:Uncharacterized protein n=1 Tax=Calocera cornea HHB12733 TaxID=1353952 RepID=A0A165CJD1_9BASI|nr:hypothetical protein CALCODRAFT_504192 [Calocera cornea HHB12733]